MSANRRSCPPRRGGRLGELRRRIEAEGAADGDVRDMRSLWIMGCFDPDGAAHEVILKRPGFADSEMLERAVWTTRDPGLTPPSPAAS